MLLLILSESVVFPHAQYMPFSTHATVRALALAARARMSAVEYIMLGFTEEILPRKSRRWEKIYTIMLKQSKE